MAPRSPTGWLLVSTLALAAAAPAPARAANCAPPPVLPRFQDVPCMSVVDRSASAVLHLDYDYAPEELALIPADVTEYLHFVAFNVRPRTLPPWLTLAQVAEAQVVYDDPDCMLPDPPPEMVLETNEDLAGTYTMLTDEPLIVAAGVAEAGFDVDTSGLAPGLYHVFGYVDSGRFPAWNMVPGGVLVVDEPAPSEDGPLALFIRELPLHQMFPGQEYGLEACAHTIVGSELDVEWRESTFDDQVAWNPVTTCFPAEAGDLNVPFLIPVEAAGKSVQFRGTLRDPAGREATHFNQFKLLGPDCAADGVDDPTCADFVPGDPGAFPTDHCSGDDGGTTGDSGDTDGTDGTNDTDGAGQDGDSAAGCGCDTNPGAPPAPLLLAPLWLLARRRGWGHGATPDRAN